MTAFGLHGFFELAPNSKLSGGPTESRRVAENGSNRDSSEAVRSGSGGAERLGERRDRRSRFFCWKFHVRIITVATSPIRRDTLSTQILSQEQRELPPL